MTFLQCVTIDTQDSWVGGLDRLDESDGWQQASSGAEEVQCTSPACWLPSSNQHAWWADHPSCNILFRSIPVHTLVFFMKSLRELPSIVFVQTPGTGLSCVGVVGVETAGCPQ